MSCRTCRSVFGYNSSSLRRCDIYGKEWKGHRIRLKFQLQQDPFQSLCLYPQGGLQSYFHSIKLLNRTRYRILHRSSFPTSKVHSTACQNAVIQCNCRCNVTQPCRRNIETCCQFLVRRTQRWRILVWRSPRQHHIHCTVHISSLSAADTF